MVSEMNRAMMWLVASVRGPFHQSNWAGVCPCRSDREHHSPGGGVSSG
jgi:hypothetical protein